MVEIDAMLLLMCRADTSRYAVDAENVIEVLPLVAVERISGGPDWLSGMFAYRGRVTPLIDMTWVVTGRDCPKRLNSRILIVPVPPEDGVTHIGLLAERITTSEISLQETGTGTSHDLGLCGPILLDSEGMFQLVDLHRLFSRYSIQPALDDLRRQS